MTYVQVKVLAVTAILCYHGPSGPAHCRRNEAHCRLPLLQIYAYSNALHAMLPAWSKGSHLTGCLLACARAVGALREVPARYVLTLRVLIADAMMLTWSARPTRPLLSSMDETRFG